MTRIKKKFKINKLIYLMLIIFTFTMSANSYEILLPNALGQKDYTFASYYGKNLEDIRGDALKKLRKTNSFFNQKLNTEYTSNINTIESQRYWVGNITKSVRYYLTINGLRKNLLKGATKIKFLAELKKLGIDLTGATKMVCDELGIQFTSSLNNLITTIIVDVITGKTPIDMVLDSIDIGNNVIAINRLQNALFYSLNSQIATSYTKYLVKYLTGGQAQVLFGNKALTVKEFLESRYIDLQSNILTKDEYYKKYGKDPEYKDMLYVKILNSDNLIDWDDYDTTSAMFLDLPGVLVGGLLDAFNDINKIFGNKYTNLLDYLEAITYERLRNIGMTTSMIQISIDDDLESSSYIKSILGRKLYIKEFSEIRINHIGIKKNHVYRKHIFACAKKGDDFGEIDKPFRKSNILSKKDIPSWCEDGKFRIRFLLKNDTSLDTFFEVYIVHRYANNSYATTLYKNIGLLKKNNISFKDSKILSPTRNIDKVEARTAVYNLRNYIANMGGKNETSKVYNYENTLTIDKKLTYGKLFQILNNILTVNYTNGIEKYYNDPFQDEDNFKSSLYLFPGNNASIGLKKLMKIKFDTISDNTGLGSYRSYLRNLSRAGIINLELISVSKKLDININFKDFIKYLSKTVEYVDAYSRIKGENK